MMPMTDSKEQTLSGATDVKDTYNKVQFKLPVNMAMQYGISLTMTWWIATAPPKRTVIVQLGN